jgi:hypothetical protein
MEGIMHIDDTQDLVVALSYEMEVIVSDFSNMALSEDLLMMLCYGAFCLYCTKKIKYKSIAHTTPSSLQVK